MSRTQQAPCITPAGVSFTFAATNENIELFIDALRRYIADHGLDGLDFDVQLLAREALVNAVRHGCGSDPGKAVVAEATLHPDRLEIRVRDEGAGWGWRQLPAEAPAPDSESGRGVFILRKYADSIEFNETGNAVCITKYLKAEAKRMADSLETGQTIVMESRIAAQNVPALREEFQQRIRNGVRQLTLDFGQVESIDSVGIGLLVATHNSLSSQGGELKLVGVPQDIFQLLTLMRLEKHFSIAKA